MKEQSWDKALTGHVLLIALFLDCRQFVDFVRIAFSRQYWSRHDGCLPVILRPLTDSTSVSDMTSVFEFEVDCEVETPVSSLSFGGL